MLISIIIPVYNRTKTIERCLDSVISQKFQDYEVIVIDDGSTDDSRSKIENYLLNNASFKGVFLPSNKGVNFARNRGIELTSGEFILFLDSDDYLSKGCLDYIASKILSLKYNHYMFSIDYRKNFIVEDEKVFTYKQWLIGEIKGDFLHVVRASCFEKFKFFEEFRASEFLNWLRIKKEFGPQLFVNYVALHVDRTDPNSLSKVSKIKDYSSARNAILIGLKFLKLYGFDLNKESKIRFKICTYRLYLLCILIDDFESFSEIQSITGCYYPWSFNFLIRPLVKVKLGFK